MPTARGDDSDRTPQPHGGELPQHLREELEAADGQAARMEVVRRYFDVRRVENDDDIRPEALYCLCQRDRVHLVRSSEPQAHDAPVPMQLALTGKRLKPLPRRTFLQWGKQGRLVYLAPKAAAASDGSSRSLEDRDADVEGPDTAGPGSEKRPDRVLDMAPFTHLLDAAKRSGLVPGADVIAHVRDREFRLGNYQRAFQLIEGLHGKFFAAATQRQQRLRREEEDIKSGRIKMSPKELLAKRARDTAQSQVVERTRSKFMRVMEGLRVLMRIMEEGP